MGKPAARALIDTGAHTGPIQSGSPNVIIGGFPAARKNDAVSCSKHGSGSIVGGSGSVFVNGLPLARLGDKTQCNTGGGAAAATPKANPPQYWGGSLAKQAGEDGMMHGKNFDARILGAYASTENKSGSGGHDTASVGFALADITQGNMKSQDILKGEMRTKVAVANATGTIYGENQDIGGFNASATATGIQYGGTAGVGKEGTLYGGVAGDVVIGSAEAKVVSETYSGDKGRWGFSGEVGAEASAIKGEAVGNVDIFGVVVADAKIGGSLGSVGASGGLTGYLDSTDYSLNLRVSGELALLVGLKGDVGVKVSWKPVSNLYYKFLGGETDAISTPPLSGDGTIITGCVTVLVGD
ncbi:PAAR domain-containing protein [Brenneria tiliae]|uniref:PAAR domain-containing protein n=1 Tax=Brenneria tiliae TaxID=2914984 RepID=UPI0020149E4E|nr:PAAR domain-containing protein [Brenneria tiliae]MCL2897394.1 PAAR domain-containing protein [Brenneria tiliae]MCL2901663.1 PAAR domain-containing protein [Brenneria tiliae]